MGPLEFLTSASQFRIGLVLGAFALALVVAAAFLGRRPGLPVAGVAGAAAMYLAVEQSGDLRRGFPVPGALPLGIVLAGVGAELAARRTRRPVPVALAALPGAVVTAGALVGLETWVRVLVAGFGAIGGALVADVDARDHAGITPVLWLVTVAGVYWTVPDTEAARAVFGATLPLAVVGWPLRIGRFGPGGAVALACALGWVIGQGGAGRPGAVVGGVATVGVFALEPVARHLLGRHRTEMHPLSDAYVVVVHCACVAAASRWAGLAVTPGAAGTRLLVFAPVAVALAAGITTVPAALARRGPPVQP
jgi:hypothetical protein